MPFKRNKLAVPVWPTFGLGSQESRAISCTGSVFKRVVSRWVQTLTHPTRGAWLGLNSLELGPGAQGALGSLSLGTGNAKPTRVRVPDPGRSVLLEYFLWWEAHFLTTQLFHFRSSLTAQAFSNQNSRAPYGHAPWLLLFCLVRPSTLH